MNLQENDGYQTREQFAVGFIRAYKEGLEIATGRKKGKGTQATLDWLDALIEEAEELKRNET